MVGARGIRHGEHQRGEGQSHFLIFFLGRLGYFCFLHLPFLQGIIIKGNPPFFTVFSRESWPRRKEMENGFGPSYL